MPHCGFSTLPERNAPTVVKLLERRWCRCLNLRFQFAVELCTHRVSRCSFHSSSSSTWSAEEKKRRMNVSASNMYDNKFYMTNKRLSSHSHPIYRIHHDHHHIFKGYGVGVRLWHEEKKRIFIPNLTTIFFCADFYWKA